MHAQRLEIVIYQDTPGLWIGRGLQHDLEAEGRTIGEAVRSVLNFVRAHAAYDARHDRAPLSTFRPAPQPYWNAFTTGTPVPLAQLGALPPPDWEIAVAIARRRPAGVFSLLQPRAITESSLRSPE
jgi:hypothetical protein